MRISNDLSLTHAPEKYFAFVYCICCVTLTSVSLLRAAWTHRVRRIEHTPHTQLFRSSAPNDRGFAAFCGPVRAHTDRWVERRLPCNTNRKIPITSGYHFVKWYSAGIHRQINTISMCFMCEHPRPVFPLNVMESLIIFMLEKKTKWHVIRNK